MEAIEYNGRKGYFYDYFRPGITADTIIYLTKPLDTSVLLSKRSIDPYKGFWCCPGGFLERGESVKAGALRELREETGLTTEETSLSFLGYHDFIEDPRGQSVNFFFTCPSHVFKGQDFHSGDGVNEIAWIKLTECDKYSIIPHHLKMIQRFFGAKSSD